MSNLPQPDKPGMVNENDQDIDVRSDILSLPSNATDDVIAFSDIPICSTIEQLTMLANKIDNQPGLFADASLFNKVTIPIDKDEKKFDQCTLDSVTLFPYYLSYSSLSLCAYPSFVPNVSVLDAFVL